MSTSTTPSAVSTRRPPVTVIVAVVVVGIQMLVGAFGLVYFGVFVGPEVNPDAGSPSAIAFAAVGLVMVVTALATLPGLWRGRRLAWHVLTCVIVAQIYFNVYKLLVEGEVDSVAFLVADVVVMVLLCLAVTRRHVSA
jgi:hypothetical protein